MSYQQNRRKFVKTAALGSILAVSQGCSGAFAGQKSDKGKSNAKFEVPPTKKAPQVKLGVTSYTFREFDLKKTLEMTERLNLKHISLKSMHLPLNTPLPEIKKIAGQVRSKGLDFYGVGVVYMKNADQVNQAFDYARAAGVRVIIGVPTYDLLKMVERKVKEYDIMLAIHNHGPTDRVYPDPKSIYDKVKNLDLRMGICMDIGHTQRCGQDPAEQALRYADRLHDIHYKDVTKPVASGSTVEMGRGVIDIPRLVKALIKINYQGIASFEFEKDGKDPLPGLAESVGYARGVNAAI